MDNSPISIPLADMVEALRVELYDSMQRSQGQNLSFRVDKVELELVVEIEKKTEAKGGIKFWVVSADAGASGRHSQVHKFKLILEPSFKGGKAQISAPDD